MSRILTLILIFVVIRGNSQEKPVSYSCFDANNKFSYSNSFSFEPIEENLFSHYFKSNFDFHNLKIDSQNLLKLQAYEVQYFNKINNEILRYKFCPGASNNNLKSSDIMRNLIINDLASHLVFRLIKPKKD